jgi:ArsR family transcriptional regulator, arsenate/arsenite/antimonite-responsive transcriptional repressor
LRGRGAVISSNLETTLTIAGGPTYFDKSRNEELNVQSPAAVTALGALANEHRLAVFRLLIQAGADGLAAGAIASALDVPNSSLSFHLAHLTQAALVAQTRRGRSLIYSANYAAMNSLVSYLMENCCGGTDACGADAACTPDQLERKSA